MIVTLPHYFPRDFQFSNSDVVFSLLKQRKRRADLFTAVSLNSLYATKCCVWVGGEDQCIALYGQVLAFSDRQVIMDGGIVVPTSAVCKVELPDGRVYLS
jgi:hypothetical protein